MAYLIVLLLLCGLFSAFVAGRKGRNRLAWWLVGALLPVFGVLLSLTATRAPAKGSAGSSQQERAHARSRRPSRCCGSYIPDCLGCPYFRRQLFSAHPSPGNKGYCEFFGRRLVEEPKRKGSEVIVEDR